jgi:hypothetical protein
LSFEVGLENGLPFFELDDALFLILDSIPLNPQYNIGNLLLKLRSQLDPLAHNPAQPPSPLNPPLPLSLRPRPNFPHPFPKQGHPISKYVLDSAVLLRGIGVDAACLLEDVGLEEFVGGGGDEVEGFVVGFVGVVWV